eukprot:scaffold3600_cov171-Amphora_coffeaeformis.AAC.6
MPMMNAVERSQERHPTSNYEHLRLKKNSSPTSIQIHGGACDHERARERMTKEGATGEQKSKSFPLVVLL